MQNEKEKVRKNNARINEIKKKGERSEKLNTDIKKTEVCLITKNKGLRLELNKAILDIACSNFQQEHDMDRLQCVNKIDLRGLTYRRRTFLLQGAKIFHEL